MNDYFDDVFKGKIPWDAELFELFMNHWHSVSIGPVDDRQVREKGITLVDGEEVKRLSFNMADPFVSQSFLFLEMMGPEHMQKYMYRCFEMSLFIKQYGEQLERDKLAIYTEKTIVLREELVHFLATSEYTKKIKRGGEISWTYDYDYVVKKANELIAKNPKSRDELRGMQ